MTPGSWAGRAEALGGPPSQDGRSRAPATQPAPAAASAVAAASPKLRSAGPDDAAALLRLKQRLDSETSFMLFEADERDASVPALASELERVANSPNSVVIVADLRGELVGYVELNGGSVRRSRTTAQVVLGVISAASGRGIGSGLLTEAKRWASAHGLHRLELTVMAHNRRAIGLYERSGFRAEGRRNQCLFVDGQFVDELFMAVFVPPGEVSEAKAQRGGESASGR
jgi:RimJ/RimL family protein N-acetyltransferase